MNFNKKNMEQNIIDKRIKELQKDSKFSFKLTSDIIDSIYRIAVNDLSKNNNEQQNNKSINNSIDINSIDINSIDIIKQNKDKDKKITELTKEIEQLKKKLSEEKSKKKELNIDLKNTNNHFQSGLITGLKFALISLENNDIENAWKLILDKYNSVNLQLKPKNF